MILESVLDRITKDRSSFIIKREHSTTTYADYGINAHKGCDVYLSLDTRRPNDLYLSLNGVSDSIVFSSWFWKDKEGKSLIKSLLTLPIHDETSPSAIMHKCFPEIMDREITKEIEKNLLGKADG
jgi:hypothetical protein